MDYTIREATKSDMPQVLNLIKELAHFEKEPDAVEVTVKDLEQDGFGPRPAFHCFVAEVNGAIEGIAAIKAITEGIVPPTINTKNIDEGISSELKLVLGNAVHTKIDVAMSNTFGFGGHNATVVFKRFE